MTPESLSFELLLLNEVRIPPPLTAWCVSAVSSANSAFPNTNPNPNPNPNPNEVKFALVSWVGEEVAPMRKARLSSLRGQASSVLSPYHTELLNVASAAEVTHEAIMKQLEA